MSRRRRTDDAGRSAFDVVAVERSARAGTRFRGTKSRRHDRPIELPARYGYLALRAELGNAAAALEGPDADDRGRRQEEPDHNGSYGAHAQKARAAKWILDEVVGERGRRERDRQHEERARDP